MYLLALSRNGLRYELFCGRHRCHSFGRGGTRYGTGFISPRCRWWRPAAFTSFAAVAAAATAALALVIPFPRIRCPCLGCGWASVVLWTVLPGIGSFRDCAIVPLGTLAARRPLFSERALWAGAAVLTVLALRPLTALIGPASLTLVRTVIAPAKAVAVAAVAATTVVIAALRSRLLRTRCSGRLGAGRGGALGFEPTEEAIDDGPVAFGRARHPGADLWRARRSGPLPRDALHDGLLARPAGCLLGRSRLCLFFSSPASPAVARG